MPTVPNPYPSPASGPRSRSRSAERTDWCRATTPRPSGAGLLTPLGPEVLSLVTGSGRKRAVLRPYPFTVRFYQRRCRLRSEATGSLPRQVPRQRRARQLQTVQPPFCEVGSSIPFEVRLTSLVSMAVQHANPYPLVRRGNTLA